MVTPARNRPGNGTIQLCRNNAAFPSWLNVNNLNNVSFRLSIFQAVAAFVLQNALHLTPDIHPALLAKNVYGRGDCKTVDSLPCACDFCARTKLLPTARPTLDNTFLAVGRSDGWAVGRSGPFAGSGIKYAIEDGVVTANLLAEPLKAGSLCLRDLAEAHCRRVADPSHSGLGGCCVGATSTGRAKAASEKFRNSDHCAKCFLALAQWYLRTSPCARIGCAPRGDHHAKYLCA
jgi:hypothetical protein